MSLAVASLAFLKINQQHIGERVLRTCLERVVAVQVAVDEMDVATVDFRRHLRFCAFDITHQTNDCICRIGGKLAEKFKL